MLSCVFFTPISSYSGTARISAIADILLARVVKEGKVAFTSRAGLKVHFGENREVRIREIAFIFTPT